MTLVISTDNKRDVKQEKHNIYAYLIWNRVTSITLLCYSLGLAGCSGSEFASTTPVKVSNATTTSTTTPTTPTTSTPTPTTSTDTPPTSTTTPPTSTTPPPTSTTTPTVTVNTNPNVTPINSAICNQNIAVALVMDVSGSMKQSAYPGSNGSFGGSNYGTTKMSVDIQTAQSFVSQFTKANDMLGLVTFSSQATVLSSMSTDKSAIQTALGQLSPQSTTNITDGLKQGAALLAGVPSSYTKILILVSDGENNGPGDPIARAAIIKQSGILIMTLGFMSDSGQTAMEAMATDSSDYFNSTDSASFISNFGIIAQKLCI